MARACAQYPYPQEALAVVRAAGDQDDVCALARRDARDFGKLDVVTHGDRDLAEGGVEDADRRSGDHVPVLGLEPRHVQLRLHAMIAARIEEKGMILQTSRGAGLDGNRAGEDVDAALPGDLAHRVDEARRLARKGSNLFRDRPADIGQRQELHRAVFGKHHELAVVVAGRLDHRLHLLAERLEAIDRTDVVLHGGHANPVHEPPRRYLSRREPSTRYRPPGRGLEPRTP